MIIAIVAAVALVVIGLIGFMVYKKKKGETQKYGKKSFQLMLLFKVNKHYKA